MQGNQAILGSALIGGGGGRRWRHPVARSQWVGGIGRVPPRAPRRRAGGAGKGQRRVGRLERGWLAGRQQQVGWPAGQMSGSRGGSGKASDGALVRIQPCLADAAADRERWAPPAQDLLYMLLALVALVADRRA